MAVPLAPRPRAVNDGVSKVLFAGCPAQVPWVDATMVAFAATMRCMMLLRWRSTMGKFAHYAVSPGGLALPFHRAVAVGIAVKRPDQAFVANVKCVFFKPRNHKVARLKRR